MACGDLTADLLRSCNFTVGAQQSESDLLLYSSLIDLNLAQGSVSSLPILPYLLKLHGETDLLLSLVHHAKVVLVAPRSF